MKQLDTNSINKIITELKKISYQLKRIENGETDIMKDFYRDSFEFMVAENIGLYETMMKLLNEKNNNLKAA